MARLHIIASKKAAGDILRRLEAIAREFDGPGPRILPEDENATNRTRAEIVYHCPPYVAERLAKTFRVKGRVFVHIQQDFTDNAEKTREDAPESTESTDDDPEAVEDSDCGPGEAFSLAAPEVARGSKKYRNDNYRSDFQNGLF